MSILETYIKGMLFNKSTESNDSKNVKVYPVTQLGTTTVTVTKEEG